MPRFPYDHSKGLWKLLIGRRLRAARTAKKLSLRDVEQRVGVTYTALQKSEVGGRDTGLWELVRLARVYGQPLEQLIGPLTPEEETYVADFLEHVRGLGDEGEDDDAE